MVACKWKCWVICDCSTRNVITIGECRLLKDNAKHFIRLECSTKNRAERSEYSHVHRWMSCQEISKMCHNVLCTKWNYILWNDLISLEEHQNRWLLKMKCSLRHCCRILAVGSDGPVVLCKQSLLFACRLNSVKPTPISLCVFFWF